MPAFALSCASWHAMHSPFRNGACWTGSLASSFEPLWQLKAGARRRVVAHEVRTIRGVRVVAGETVAAHVGRVLVGLRDGLLHVRVTVHAQLLGRLLEHELLRETVTAMAHVALLLRDGFVHELLRAVLLLRFLAIRN